MIPTLRRTHTHTHTHTYIYIDIYIYIYIYGEKIINTANMYLINLLPKRLGRKLIKYMFALLMIISPFITNFQSF